MTAYEEMKRGQDAWDNEQRRVHLEGHGEIPDGAIFKPHYAPLPDTLQVGMKLACPKHYPQPCVYEVVKVDGDRVWIANAASLMLHNNFTVGLLRGYDYALCVEEKNDER